MARLSLNPLYVGCAALACLLAAPAGAAPVRYEVVTVGNPGNANDTGGSGLGAVAYEYQIGEHDVTIGQYAEFLNAVAATDPYSLYNANMGTDGNIMGIEQSGSSGSYTYSVIGSADRPITYVSWFDAARFANWMTNGQGSSSTETGAYTLNGAINGDAVAANPGAAFRLPTLNEWYKAAYYSPTLNGAAGGYYTYATQSDLVPGNQVGGTANQANYQSGAGYSVTQSPSYSSSQNYLTDVGAFSGSASFYGTYDQSGLVYEWNDLDGATGPTRGTRGGDWGSTNPFGLSSSDPTRILVPDVDGSLLGFRLAISAVPEIDPSSFASALALVCGAIGLLERRRSKAV